MYKPRAGHGKRKFENLETFPTDPWVKRHKRYENSQLNQVMKQLEDALKDQIVSAIKQDFEKKVINLAKEKIIRLAKNLSDAGQF